MRQYQSRSAIWIIALLTTVSLSNHRLSAQVPDADTNQSPPVIEDQITPPETPVEEQPEVLSRGPVHEAFAEPVTLQLQTGLIAPQPPPPNIEEVPPAEKPQGQQFVWIPGYWSWDADRNGYIWVSACWRAAPPKMSWVPGYWAEVSGGWEWISGYWAPAGVKEIVYLPAPPPIEDVEPVSFQPSPDAIWVPPCMYWSNGQYIRRSGYWLKAQPDWIWVPSHYVMTPHGYVFAAGHWDYALERRGVLFAPVYFPPSVYRRVSFTYSPSIIVDVGVMRVSLFTYPRYCHYYFGDYYDGAYLRIGIYPWFESRRYRTWYDPCFEHDRWRHHRSEPRWEEHRRDDYRRRCDDKNLRPAHTFREQESRMSKLPEPQRHTSKMVQPIETAVSDRKTPLKFEKIGTDARQNISKQATAVHTFRNDRNRWESPPVSPKTSQPSGERKTPEKPSAERKETVSKPSEERKTTVRPPAERKPTGQPTEERKTSVTSSAERKQTVQPAGEYKTTVVPPTGRKPTVQPPKKTESPMTAPDSQRKPASIPSRETQISRPERVQIPASPVTGGSGKRGIFTKGPPTRPAEESRGQIKMDSRQK